MVMGDGVADRGCYVLHGLANMTSAASEHAEISPNK